MSVDLHSFVLKIEWCGPETKPVSKAGLATEDRMSELEAWRAEEGPVCNVATVTQAEGNRLEQIVGQSPFAMRSGRYEPKHTVQQYIVSMNSRGEDYYCEMGFSQQTLLLLETISGCLEGNARRALKSVLDQVRAWKC